MVKIIMRFYIIICITLMFISGCASNNTGDSNIYLSKFEHDFATGIDAVAEFISNTDQKIVLISINNPENIELRVWLSQEYKSDTEVVSRRNIIYKGRESSIRKLIKIAPLSEGIKESVCVLFRDIHGKSIMSISVMDTDIPLLNN